jgi:N6-adenosine-specific RNA methylase IME4
MIHIQGGPFRVVYADPPWRWGDGRPKPRSLDIDRHYPTMPLEDICSIKIPVEKNAVLFLWATAPKLEEAFFVVKAWGFKYKAMIVWDKGVDGRSTYGNYCAVNHELLLVCTRGSCTPDCKVLFDSVQSCARSRHSEKPAFFRMMIDKLYPHGKRIELFVRGSLPEGWQGFGNEFVSAKEAA